MSNSRKYTSLSDNDEDDPLQQQVANNNNNNESTLQQQQQQTEIQINDQPSSPKLLYQQQQQDNGFIRLEEDDIQDEMDDDDLKSSFTNSTIGDDEHLLIHTSSVNDIRVSSKLYYVPPNRSSPSIKPVVATTQQQQQQQQTSASVATAKKQQQQDQLSITIPSPTISGLVGNNNKNNTQVKTPNGASIPTTDGIFPESPTNKAISFPSPSTFSIPTPTSLSPNASGIILPPPLSLVDQPASSSSTSATTSSRTTNNAKGETINNIGAILHASNEEEHHHNNILLSPLSSDHSKLLKSPNINDESFGSKDPPVQDFVHGNKIEDEDILQRILQIKDFKFQKKHKKKAIHYLLNLVPIVSWIKGYKWTSDIKGDLVAGLTVGVMLIPQGMAYAMVAGLPPIYGLYSSIAPVIAYSIFGTSRELSVGPFAIISLLCLETVNGEVGATSTNMQHRVSVSILLAFVCGILQLILGLLRFGFVANFLSDPVKTGFISGCALIIGSSQIKHILGYSVDNTNFLPLLIGRYLAHITKTNWWAVFIGVLGIVMLVGIKKINARFKIKIPGPLVVVILFTLLSFLIDFENRGHIPVVGHVPSGIPSPRFPTIQSDPGIDVDTNWFGVTARILPGALVLVLVGFISSVSVSSKFAEKNNYTIDANQELIALGASDFVGSFFLAFPVGASLSRTAVNAQSGAVSQLAGIVCALIIVIAILLLTPVVYFLPKAILASIVVVAIVDLIEYKIAFQLWKVHRKDLVLYCVSLFSTITLGILQGILIGIVASLLLIIYRSAYPPFAVLGRLPGTEIYKNIKRVPQAETFKGIQIVRIDGSIYFANTQFIKKKLRGYEPFRKRGVDLDDMDSSSDQSDDSDYDDSSIVEMATVDIDGNPTKGAIIIDCSSMNDIDSTGIRMLKELVMEFRAKQLVLYFASVKGYIRDLLKKGGVVEHYGADHFFWTINDAVEHHLYLIKHSRRNQLKKSRALNNNNNNNQNNNTNTTSSNTFSKDNSQEEYNNDPMSNKVKVLLSL
ncbi:Sulfate transporter [Cavenderia fasciculata]|uniref:Sulfate transporter n=1 Tax=Cavenderia fasciculata TaxID=261658 RepID=F4PI22_CACFS|nr:Sulfate transporter [Cavenderia fasciculata]EGG24509.1 Sulfate transporter [Cavenderia fasciculata]|eukprot:XP_004362360.1 Sulfate transporter [Cavenderia fasciculata]